MAVAVGWRGNQNAPEAPQSARVQCTARQRTDTNHQIETFAHHIHYPILKVGINTNAWMRRDYARDER